MIATPNGSKRFNAENNPLRPPGIAVMTRPSGQKQTFTNTTKIVDESPTPQSATVKKVNPYLSSAVI